MTIQIRGAREHNLRGIDATFGDGLTVVTGVSGSGKTSLVFDTLYHEARRRYLEVFSQGSTDLRLAPAKVQDIVGLGPAISVGQNLLNRNPHSTLASASGLHPFFRLLYARYGVRHCVRCGSELTVLTEDEIVDQLSSMARQMPLSLFAPVLHGARGSHRTLLQLLIAEFGTDALRVDGESWTERALDPATPHHIEVEITHLEASVPIKAIRQAIRTAAALGAQAVVARWEGQQRVMARVPVCIVCGVQFHELEPVHFRNPCSHCAGEGCDQCSYTGLHPEAANVRWNGLRLPELLKLSVTAVCSLIDEAFFPTSAARLQTEIRHRLDALSSVGLGYIGLDRPSPTLSRGEAQRVRLAVALVNRLEDMLHVLDEPTIGQHAADVARLLPVLRRLPGPVVCVEHDRTATAFADQVVDLGPGAGNEGGRVVFSGSPADLWQADTPTGRAFSLRERVPIPSLRAEPEWFLTVLGAHLHNLQGIDVVIPTGRLTVVTGVSGSGKSTLVKQVLVASLLAKEPIGCDEIDGPILKPALVTQDPIGRNPRSNPATYTKLADIIRDGFAAATGLSASHFSFNRSEGACEICKGMGAIEIKMRYLPSTWIRCAACNGRRFSEEMLAAEAPVDDRWLSIADLYEMPLFEVQRLLAKAEWLTDAARLNAERIFQALDDVGLGYLPLGQPSTTLSGGEAQRVKLAKTLGQRSLPGRLLVLDEPSTGLHPQDVGGLLIVLDRLVRSGATVVVVEHNTDIIRAADWIIDLGPGAGPAGGHIQYAGPPAGLAGAVDSITAQKLREEAAVQPRKHVERGDSKRSSTIAIRNACANNLRSVDIEFPKGKITVVTGVSGSGKSSLVSDVLEAEAHRRFLETLSLYERQGMREGPESLVGSVTGLGVAITVGPDRQRFSRRSTVGTSTEIGYHLAVLLSWLGRRLCLRCGVAMKRVVGAHGHETWFCTTCEVTAPVAQPRHFSPSNYGAACLTCHGVGSLQIPDPEKLIVAPEKPLCAGAMYSPGFFPKGYLCQPRNGGYDMVQALAARYKFDPATTPWQAMAPKAQRAFLFGDPEPMQVTFHGRSGRIQNRTAVFPGFYGWIRDWDVGGTYTNTRVCSECDGGGLRPEYLAVYLNGYNMHQLSEMPMSELAQVLGLGSTECGSVVIPDRYAEVATASLDTMVRRLRFLSQVGLGYLHLNRISSTLSAGEAQRIKLAGLLGSSLTSLTVLLDEPSRGLHPSEVRALLRALITLRDEGNTVIMVEHDLDLIRAADFICDMGPGAGKAGGKVIAQGSPQAVAMSGTATGQWLRGKRYDRLGGAHPEGSRQHGALARRREPPGRGLVELGSTTARKWCGPSNGWLTILGACANNLCSDTVRLPLRTLAGVCGVSGSGKSTLLIDTLGRALAPKKQTTSVAYEPIEPGDYESIEGAPARVVIVDQAKAGVTNPAGYLNLSQSLLALYSDSADALALGLDSAALSRSCSTCKGRGSLKTDLGFLPDVFTECETCRGTGYLPEAWEIRLKGYSLPELLGFTIDQAYELFSDEDSLARPLRMAQEVGLGYLVLRQPGHALSGGEAQRLKIVKELCRKSSAETLFILDEPTVGQHLEDVVRLTGVLRNLVDRETGPKGSPQHQRGHTVVVSEHHPHLLVACDWLIELGPGGGPAGGRVIAQGTPETLAGGESPTAPYLRELLEVVQ